MAAEICARYPASYAGAIVMSPGGMGESAVFPTTLVAEHRTQKFWVVCMAMEHPGNVELTRACAQRLKELGAEVVRIEYPCIREHARPPDFRQRFPEWIGAILKLKENK